MFLNSLLIGISSSIDSLGIGITYGINKTKISYVFNLILFFSSFIVTTISMLFGNFINNILSISVANFIGNFFIIILGIFMIVQSFTKKNSVNTSAFIPNHNIRDALFLGIALSLDNFCIVISSTMVGIYNLSVPLIISIFQILFLKLGNIIGHKIQKNNIIPDNTWSIISGIILITIGIMKLF